MTALVAALAEIEEHLFPVNALVAIQDVERLTPPHPDIPRNIAKEAIRREWTDNRMIVIQRGRINILWKMRIARR